MHRTDLMHVEHTTVSDALHVVQLSIDPGYYRAVATSRQSVLPTRAVVLLNTEGRKACVTLWDARGVQVAQTFDDWDQALDYRPGVRAVFADAVAKAVDVFDLGPRRN